MVRTAPGPGQILSALVAALLPDRALAALARMLALAALLVRPRLVRALLHELGALLGSDRARSRRLALVLDGAALAWHGRLLAGSPSSRQRVGRLARRRPALLVHPRLGAWPLAACWAATESAVTLDPDLPADRPAAPAWLPWLGVLRPVDLAPYAAALRAQRSVIVLLALPDRAGRPAPWRSPDLAAGLADGDAEGLAQRALDVSEALARAAPWTVDWAAPRFAFRPEASLAGSSPRSRWAPWRARPRRAARRARPAHGVAPPGRGTTRPRPRGRGRRADAAARPPRRPRSRTATAG
jgi:hypothetical protein